MKKGVSSSSFRKSNSKKRKGIHSKSKRSVNKGSKNYKKKYRGQGK